MSQVQSATLNVLQTSGDRLLLNTQPLSSGDTVINGFFLMDGRLICQYTGATPDMILNDSDHVVWNKA